MLEKAAEVFELGHRHDQLLQVFEAPGGVGRAVGLPHRGIARFVEHDLHEIGVRNTVGLGAPAVERGDKRGERVARRPAAAGRRRSSARAASTNGSRSARASAMELLQGGAADAAARGVQDALEGEVVGGLVDEAQIGERVADLLALVKARAADDPVGQGQRDEPLLEFAGLEAGAHQDRDLARAHGPGAATPRSRRRPSAPPPRRPTMRGP